MHGIKRLIVWHACMQIPCMHACMQGICMLHWFAACTHLCSGNGPGNDLVTSTVFPVITLLLQLSQCYHINYKY